MKLKNVCTLDVISCKGQSSIIEAAKQMRDHHVGNVVVVEDDEDDALPVGILTDRDIVVEVVSRNLDPQATTVASVMSTPIVVADESEDVTDALQRMRMHGVRRIVVTGAHGALTGIFTLDDMLRLNAEQAAVSLDLVAKEQRRAHRTRRG
jgi:CBS domain-containing protein